MTVEELLTENEVIEFMVDWLNKKGWNNIRFKKNGEKGIDIEASLRRKKIIIEAKGARANDNSKIKKRKKFDSGQIHTHLGKALVKILCEMHQHNSDKNIEYGIVQPLVLRNTIIYSIEPRKKLNIKLFWVKIDGTVILE